MIFTLPSLIIALLFVFYLRKYTQRLHKKTKNGVPLSKKGSVKNISSYFVGKVNKLVDGI